MSVSGAEVARPILLERGLLGRAEPILIAGGRAVDHSKEVFVGIDVAKVRNAFAIADGERGGEVRYLGEVDASEAPPPVRSSNRRHSSERLMSHAQVVDRDIKRQGCSGIGCP